MTYIDKFEVVTPQDFLRRHIEAVEGLGGAQAWLADFCNDASESRRIKRAIFDV